MKHQPDQTTTPGTPCPTLFEKYAGSLTSPANQYTEDAGDGAYGLSFLSKKTRTSNHLRMSLQRQHILLSYFKTLSVSPVWGSNPRPPAQQSGSLPIELTRRRFLSFYLFFFISSSKISRNRAAAIFENKYFNVIITSHKVIVARYTYMTQSLTNQSARISIST